MALCGSCAQSSPTLCDPIDCSPPGSSIHGISQARILEWVAKIPLGSSQPRDWTCVSCISFIGGRFFTISVTCTQALWYQQQSSEKPKGYWMTDTQDKGMIHYLGWTQCDGARFPHLLRMGHSSKLISVYFWNFYFWPVYFWNFSFNVLTKGNWKYEKQNHG